MSRSVRRCLAALAALLVGSGASAGDAAQRNDTKLDEQKLEAASRELAQLFRLTPIHQLAAAGAEVRRAYLSDGIGRYIAAVSFTRANGESPYVTITLPVTTFQREPVRAPVPASVWQEVISLSQNFDRSLVPLPTPTSDEIRVCIHPWGAYVEAVERRSEGTDATVRRKAGNACDDELALPYAFWLAQQAINTLPSCQQISPDDHRNAAAIVAECGKLAGDRLAAVEVLNILSASSFARPRDWDSALSLRTFFSDDARVVWSGDEALANGGVDLWFRKMREGHNTMLWVDRYTGLDVDHVRVQGRIEGYRDVGSDRVLFSAPVHQEWVRYRPYGFKVKEIIVGQAVRAKPR